MPPKVSVNIPAYNSEKYIRETIKSALNQTFRDFEIIVIDDGSSDKTGEIIKSFDDSRIKYFYQENRGIGAARNKAIEKSSGEYIAFLDHDDLWLPQKIEKQIRLFESNPDLGLVFCDTIFFNEKEDLFSVYSNEKPPQGMIFRDLLKKYFLCLLTVIVRRGVLDDVGLFPSHMMMAEEYDLFLRIAYKYPLDYVDEPLARYRIHQQNYSWGMDRKVIVEERETFDRLRKFIPGFNQKYKDEITLKNSAWLRREGMILWREGEKKKAREIFRRLAKESPGIKMTILANLSFFISFKIFRLITNLIRPKKKKIYPFL